MKNKLIIAAISFLVFAAFVVIILYNTSTYLINNTSIINQENYNISKIEKYNFENQNTGIMKKGSLIVQNLDKINNSKLKGAVIKIYNLDTGSEIIESIDDEVEVELDYGKYIIKEISPADQYLPIDAYSYFSLSDETPSYTVVLRSDKIEDFESVYEKSHEFVSIKKNPITLDKKNSKFILIFLVYIFFGVYVICFYYFKKLSKQYFKLVHKK